MGMDFGHSCWNLLDLGIVIAWILEKSLRSSGSNPLVLRILRLCKVGRLIKMFQTLQAFDGLQILAGAILASQPVMLWSGLSLLLFQVLAGIFVLSMLTGYMKDTSNDLSQRLRVWEDWGTFTRATITMFDITLANHAPPTWRLINNVSEWWGLFLLLYKFVVGFAVVRVISGVFLHETFKVADANDDLMTLQKKRKSEEHVAKMCRLLHEADVNKNGHIEPDELRTVFENEEMKTWLSAQGLDVGDTDIL